MFLFYVLILDNKITVKKIEQLGKGDAWQVLNATKIVLLRSYFTEFLGELSMFYSIKIFYSTNIFSFS